MTTEMQTFISPDEIIGFRFQCACGAKISLPLSEESRKRLSDAKVIQCPSCHEQWFQGTQDNRLVLLAGVMAKLLEMRSIAKDFKLKTLFELNADVVKKAI